MSKLSKTEVDREMRERSRTPGPGSYRLSKSFEDESKSSFRISAAQPIPMLKMMLGDAAKSPPPGTYRGAERKFGSAIPSGHIGVPRQGFIEHAVVHGAKTPGPGVYINRGSMTPSRNDFRDSTISPFSSSGRADFYASGGPSSQILRKFVTGGQRYI